MKIIKALILAAGYATRLFPLTENYPKPLLVVGEKPIIEYILDKIKEVPEIDEVYIITNNKYTPRFLDWKKQYTSDIPIKLINDGTLSAEDAIGAVGDIHYTVLKHEINDDLLIIAGDNLFEFSLKKFIRSYLNNSSLALYDLQDPIKLSRKFGTVEIDQNRKIIGFEEKPVKPKTSLAATFCYLLRKQDIKHLHSYVEEGNNLNNGGDFIKYLSNKVDVYGFSFTENWFDIGNFDGLEQADKIYSNK
ncbi:nucleotidyltransferase family protein [Candidatus Woesearchaeota archaeon]|nr:nucleotidyltransferase family protein [Candidatus Woesearchaeota archaeon]